MSISEDFARTSSETVFAEMFTDFPRGSSKQGSQQSRSSSAATPLFSSLLVPCYCGEEETTTNRPLQKRERTGKEYGCFPFV